MQSRINMLENQVLMLQAEVDSMESNKRAVDELQAVNLRLRDSKQKVETEMNDVKKNNGQLLDMVWDVYKGYNQLLNEIIASCEKNEKNALQTIKENTQKQNHQIVQKVVNDVSSWDKSATEHAVGMALIFNQEKRRIALKKRFSKNNTPRSRWF